MNMNQRAIIYRSCAIGLLLAFPACLSGPIAWRVGSDGGANVQLAADVPAFESAVVPFIEEHCLSCHDAADARGDLDLETFIDSENPQNNIEMWERVQDMVSGGLMPPENRPRPDESDQANLLNWIEARIQADVDEIVPDPGRVTARRLNRAEYNNTVRDLLGVAFRPADDFPPDDTGYGFDTIGDVLSLSPMLMEKYLDAAETIAPDALAADRQAIESGATVRHILVCGHAPDKHTAACARRIMRDLSGRAFRRPVKQNEVKRLTELVKSAQNEGAAFEEAIELGVAAVLVSPHFLFRIEHDRTGLLAPDVYRLDDFEFASRLSYFLWSSMPDERLMNLAASGALRERDALNREVDRMIADPKADAFVENFTGQWLQLRNLAVIEPNPDRFPEFDDTLREAMARETEMLFATVMRENLSVMRLLDADFTFVNNRLAEHYGLQGVDGDVFRRVELDRAQRGGILTHASVLTLTSYPSRTSPVLRGQFILENILGAPPPPPPADVPPLDEAQAEKASNMREQLEKHRADPGCASCHNRMDPLGFGFENYDPIGAWRAEEDGVPIDSSGTLPNGDSFSGPVELRAILGSRGDEFARCLAEKMLTYALGRGLERYDRIPLDEICQKMAADDYRFTTLVMGVVNSLPFQKRRGEETAG